MLAKSLVQFNSVESLSRVWLFATHGLQHARLPCPSPTPGACSTWCLLSWRCHPTISSSVVPFSSCLQSFPASGCFPLSQFFTSGGQSIGASASPSVHPMNIQDWFPLGWTVRQLTKQCWAWHLKFLVSSSSPLQVFLWFFHVLFKGLLCSCGSHESQPFTTLCLPPLILLYSAVPEECQTQAIPSSAAQESPIQFVHDSQRDLCRTCITFSPPLKVFFIDPHHLQPSPHSWLSIKASSCHGSSPLFQSLLLPPNSQHTKSSSHMEMSPVSCL